MTDARAAAGDDVRRVLDELVPVISASDVERAIEGINRQAAQLLGVDHAITCITTDRARTGAPDRLAEGSLRSVFVAAGVGPADWLESIVDACRDLVQEAKRPIRIPAGSSREERRIGRGEVLAVPLAGRDGDTIGLIVVAGRADGSGFDTEDEELLVSLARVASASIERTQLVRDLADEESRRQAFFGVLSHELRTPITTIYGGTRVLNQSGSRLSHDARQQLIGDIAADAERLFRLIEDLLVLSRAEQDGLDAMPDPVLLQHLLPRVVAAEQARWPRARFRVSVPADLPPVAGDETFVDQVVRNLLSNAAKYASPGGPIEINVDRADDWVSVRVLDSGPGLALDEWTKVFGLFYRAPSAAGRAQGAGIGLYACRALIRAMEGDIWARPRDGSGAEFGFRLRVHALADDDPA